jgi:glycosyltransferase involved in cell wall biosynthesis
MSADQAAPAGDAEGRSKSAPDHVVCCLVTLPVAGRLQHVKSSVGHYIAQTHPNRELLVAVNGGEAEGRRGLLDYIASVDRPDVRSLEIPGDLPLGEVRNIALDHCEGQVYCQWDDDDLQHPERLAVQLRAMTDGGFEAAYLQEVVQYVPAARRLYWTNWVATEDRVHAGTLMMRLDTQLRYPPKARLGEDSGLAAQLNAREKVLRIAGMPHLMVYVTHGANSWSGAHHANLIERLAISRGLLLRREAALREGLRPFRFEAYPVEVHGNNGVAFTIDAQAE